jgi:hypothetical protein
LMETLLTNECEIYLAIKKSLFEHPNKLSSSNGEDFSLTFPS